MKWKWKLLSRVRLCNPMDYTVPGILQARILEWAAFPFSRGSSQPRDRTQISCIADGFLTSWAMRETPVWSEVMAKKHSAQFPSTRETIGVSSSWNGFASQPSALSSTPSCPCWLQMKLPRRGHPPESLPSGEEDSPLLLLTSLFGVNCPGSSLLAQGHGLNMPERSISRKFRSANQQAPSLSQQIPDQIIVP